MSSTFTYNGEIGKFSDFKRILINSLHSENLYEYVFGKVLPPVKPDPSFNMKQPLPAEKPDILTASTEATISEAEYKAAHKAYFEDKARFQREYMAYLEYMDKQSRINSLYKKQLQEFQDRQGKALGCILKMLGRHAMAIIQSDINIPHPDPVMIYNKLSATFEKSTEYISVTNLYNKLGSMRYKDNADMVVFIQMMEDTMSSLSSCGERLSENYKFSIIFNAFNHDDMNPMTKNEYKLLLNICSMSKKSYTELKDMLISKYLELKNIKSSHVKPHKDSKEKSINAVVKSGDKLCTWCDMTNHNTDECGVLKRLKEKNKQSKETNSKEKEKEKSEKVNNVDINVNSILTTDEKHSLVGLDSMASCHICNDLTFLSDISEVNTQRIIAFNGNTTQCSKTGSLGMIKPVLYIPDSKYTLLSWGMLVDQGFQLIHNKDKDHILLYYDKKYIACFTNQGNLYLTSMHKLMTQLNKESESSKHLINATNHETRLEDNRFNFPDKLDNSKRSRCIQIADLHEKLNHINAQHLGKILTSEINDTTLTGSDLKNYEAYSYDCKGCSKGKLTQHPHRSSEGTEYDIGQLIVTDLFVFNHKWFIILVDVASRYVFVSCLTTKSSDAILDAILEFKSIMNSANKNIQTIRSDSESNYKALESELNSNGMRLELSAPGQHNVRAESYINIIKSNARCLIHANDYTIPRSLYPYAIESAVSTYNHTPHHLNNMISPYEKIFDKRVFTLEDLTKKPHFGAIGEFRIPIENLASHNQRSETGIVIQPLLANCKQGVQVYIIQSRSIVTRSHFKLTNDKSMLNDIDHDTYSDEEENTNTSAENIEQPSITADIAYGSADPDNQVNYWAYNVNHEKTDKLKASLNITPSFESEKYEITQHYINMVAEDIKVSHSINSAMTKDEQLTINAIRDELRQLLELNVFQPIFEEEINGQIIPSQMIIKMKYLPNGLPDRMKARLVAGGHKQAPLDFNDRYAPTTTFTNVMVHLNICSYEKRSLATIDIKGAYLHASLNNAIYMKIDKRCSKILVELNPSFSQFMNNKGIIVVKLLKTLYGLQESAQLWYQHISNTLKKIHLLPIANDPCMFHTPNNDLLVNLHVDDMLVSYKSPKDIEKLTEHISQNYSGYTCNTGKQLNFLGLEINQSEDQSCISINQSGYIESILTKYECQSTSHYPSKLSFFEDLSKEGEPYDQHRYMSIVTSLLYLAQRTRPDILKEIILLTTRNQNPTINNYQQASMVLSYISHTKHRSLDIRCQSLDLHAFADASFKCHPDRRSHSGGMVTLGPNNSMIKCISKKQSLTALSSFEAELVAISDVYKHANYIKNTLQFIFTIPFIINWQCDNQSVINTLMNSQPTNIKNSHIDVKYYFLREKIAQNELNIEYCPTNDMKADLLTKCIRGDQFHSKSWFLTSYG